MKILLTTTSFQDTPGRHHELLHQTGYKVDTLRGPLKEKVLLPIMAKYDGVICGDDEFSRKVIENGGSGKLKTISKYGVGLDKIDLNAAKDFGIPVYNTPGVNHITVAEHVLALILTYLKNVHLAYNITKDGGWKRLTGHELYGKKVGVLGLGKIGKEVVKRLSVFGVDIFVYDLEYDELFLNQYSITPVENIYDLVRKIEILSINIPLMQSTIGIINKDILSVNEKGLIIVNTSRALIIDPESLHSSLESGVVKAYLTDVMDEEPIIEDHPLLHFDNVLITPHVGSRTYESVVRQGCMAVENLTKSLERFNQ